MKRSGPPERKTPMPRGESELTRTPFKRTGARMRQVGRKRGRQNRTYSQLRREFLADNPICGFPEGCYEAADTVQHLRGRRGERLNDQRYWAPSCLAHNLWAEDHTGEALAMGWLILIEGVA